MEFPPSQELFGKDVTGKADRFRWAKHFVTAAKNASLPHSPAWSEIQMATEYSGSGCAEIAMHSVAVHLGIPTANVHHCSAADVDGGCREVLLKSRAVLRSSVLIYQTILDICLFKKQMFIQTPAKFRKSAVYSEMFLISFRTMCELLLMSQFWRRCL